MKSKKILLLAIILGSLSGALVSYIILNLQFINQEKSLAYEKLVSVPLTEISSYTLLRRIENNASDFVILDVRNKDSYEMGHIKDAISMPLSEIQTRYKELLKYEEIVVYCWSGECMLGPTSSALLAKLGFSNIKELRIGWCEWSERGYPIDGRRYIVKGECLQPQRSINNETVEIIDWNDIQSKASSDCVEGQGTC